LANDERGPPPACRQRPRQHRCFTSARIHQDVSRQRRQVIWTYQTARLRYDDVWMLSKATSSSRECNTSRNHADKSSVAIRFTSSGNNQRITTVSHRLDRVMLCYGTAAPADGRQHQDRAVEVNREVPSAMQPFNPGGIMPVPPRALHAQETISFLSQCRQVVEYDKDFNKTGAIRLNRRGLDPLRTKHLITMSRTVLRVK